MHACAYAVCGIEKITFHRASNVRAACVAAKAVKTQSEILAQLKILQKMNLIEDLEKMKYTIVIAQENHHADIRKILAVTNI